MSNNTFKKTAFIKINNSLILSVFRWWCSIITEVKNGIVSYSIWWNNNIFSWLLYTLTLCSVPSIIATKYWDLLIPLGLQIDWDPLPVNLNLKTYFIKIIFCQTYDYLLSSIIDKLNTFVYNTVNIHKMWSVLLKVYCW